REGLDDLLRLGDELGRLAHDVPRSPGPRSGRGVSIALWIAARNSSGVKGLATNADAPADMARSLSTADASLLITISGVLAWRWVWRTNRLSSIPLTSAMLMSVTIRPNRSRGSALRASKPFPTS